MKRVAIASALLAAVLSTEADAAQDNAAANHGSHEASPTQAELTRQAMEMYQAKNPAKALELMWRAVELYPDNPASHLNYASLTYQFALELKRQGEAPERWQRFGKEAEREFSEAIRRAPKSGDSEAAGALAGHATFLLGDLHWYLYGDAQRARQFFNDSLRYWPGNDEAQRGLDQLEPGH